MANALFGGLFQQALLKHLSGDKKAVAALQANVRLIVPQLVPAPAKSKPRRRTVAA